MTLSRKKTQLMRIMMPLCKLKMLVLKHRPRLRLQPRMEERAPIMNQKKRRKMKMMTMNMIATTMKKVGTSGVKKTRTGSSTTRRTSWRMSGVSRQFRMCSTLALCPSLAWRMSRRRLRRAAIKSLGCLSPEMVLSTEPARKS